ncbi:MAG: PD-(D/E)XK nuclease family protein [Candidatus Aminicenantes bacterium]|nr:PD-(D/E)XK nuclease family protein [Candidatus Aminicenantes bacterium]
MTTFKNEFSWSFSRDDTFRKCRRMYYFQYYGFWGGWDFAADKRTRTIYILKQLQNRQMWAGGKVHECIQNTLNEIKSGIGKIDIEQKIETTLNLMRKEFLSSKNKKYLTDPKTCALFEHEYGLDLSQEEWQFNADNVVECLKKFFNSDVYKEISQLSDNQWLELEQFPFFYLEDFKIYAALDFAFRRNYEIIIYDWKTGREDPEKDKFQLACYGLFAIHEWNIKSDKVKLVDLFLSSGNQNELSLEDFEINEIQDRIMNSTNEIIDMLDDPQKNIAREDCFSFSDNEQICHYCNYSKICPKS